MAHQDETTPLLTNPHEQYIEDESATTREPQSSSSQWQFLPDWSPTQWRVVIATALLLLSLNFGNFMAQAPQLQIFEDIICRNYVQSLNSTSSGDLLLNDAAAVVDDICKSPAVQKELALVTGWKNTFDTLPSVALALPFGILADKIGRKPVTIMALSSLLCSEAWSRIVCWFNLPIRLLWLAGLFQVPGGGDLVALTMLMTIVSDTFSAEERASAMFRLTAMSIVAEIVATPLGAIMLKSNPWVPYMLGLVIMIVCTPFVIFLPETLNQMGAKDGMQEEDSDDTSQLSPAKNETITQIVVARAQEFIASSRFLWTSPRVLISIIAVFAGSLDKSSGYLFIQYVSAKFHWSIADASYLISVRGCMTLATLLIVLPILSFFLTRYLHYDAITKDLSIARFAAVSGIVGYFLIFIASTTFSLLAGTLFISFSIPFVWSVVSVAASFVPSQNQIATLYAAMSVSKSVGGVVAGPIFASLYGVGMQMGLKWSGLPFAVGSIIFFLTLIPVVCIRAQARSGEVS